MTLDEPVSVDQFQLILQLRELRILTIIRSHRHSRGKDITRERVAQNLSQRGPRRFRNVHDHILLRRGSFASHVQDRGREFRRRSSAFPA